MGGMIGICQQNLGDDSTLGGHLLQDLEPKGVPSNLKRTMLAFNYNKIEELEEIVANHDIGVIKMEVSEILNLLMDF